MKTLLLAFLYLLAKVQAGEDLDGESCLIDSQCISFCCSNNKNYADNDGICQSIDENPRCEARAKRNMYLLVTLLSFLFLTIAACSIARHRMDEDKRRNLRQIKIHAINQKKKDTMLRAS